MPRPGLRPRLRAAGLRRWRAALRTKAATRGYRLRLRSPPFGRTDRRSAQKSGSVPRRGIGSSGSARVPATSRATPSAFVTRSFGWHAAMTPRTSGQVRRGFSVTHTMPLCRAASSHSIALGLVRQVREQPVALLEAEAVESIGKPIDALVELGMGERACALDDCDAGGVLVFTLSNAVDDGHCWRPRRRNLSQVRP